MLNSSTQIKKTLNLSKQSVREPMMSMVPEENANTAGNGNTSNQSPDSKDQKPQPTAKQLPKLSRAAQSILQMRTVGAVVKQVTGARNYDIAS